MILNGRLKRERVLALFFVSLLALAAAGGAAFAADAPFAGAANWGGTGLMEIPTARVLSEGRYRVGASQIDPYRYYYGAVSPFAGLEIGGRVTEILGVPALLEGYGNDKDKAVDLKYQLLSEGKWTPALAVGIMDPHGTRRFASQYLVASKQIYPFDFTIGFGNGRFGKRSLPAQGEGIRIEMLSDNASWRRDGQFFGGIEFAATEELSLMAEYSPIRYHEKTNDTAQPKYFREAVPSKLNIGLRWRPLSWLEADLSWQRGNQFGANLSVAFDLGVPLIPLYDHPYRESPEHRQGPLAARLERALAASGFGSIGVLREGEELWITARNNRYYYTPRAFGVMLQVVAAIVPADVRRVRLILTENGIPKTAMAAERDDAALLAAERLTTDEFLRLLEREGGLPRPASDSDMPPGLRVRKKAGDYWGYGLNPSIRMFLNDPSGFLKYRLGVRGWVSLYPWTGASLVTGLEIHPLNTVSTSNEPLSRPVRTDIVPYQQNKVSLGMLMGEQIVKLPHQIYGKLAGGLLEIQYGGLDGEVAMPLFSGRLLVGLSGSLVKKRDPDDPFRFKSNDFKEHYLTGFINTRLNLPEVEGAVDLKLGQFLAGDRGTRVTVSKFINGVILSAWYSRTDTDIFADSFNRGYHDKGVALTIPIRLFRGKDTKTAYSFSFSPWTRDVAQDIDHFSPLFDVIGRDTEIYLRKDAAARDGRNASLSPGP